MRLDDEIAWLDRRAQAQGGHLRQAYARVGAHKRGMPLAPYLIRKARSAVRPRELMGLRVEQRKRDVEGLARVVERAMEAGARARAMIMAMRADREVGRG